MRDVRQSGLPRRCIPPLTRAVLIGLAALAAMPASAQVNVEAGLTTDYRLRGYSLSHGEPAATLALSYDDASGAFAELTGTAIHMPHGGVGFMGAFATLGYAHRIGGEWAIDGGVMRAQYTPDSSFGRNTGYTEIFAGATGRSVALRLALSPDYFWDRTVTLYGSAEVFKRPADHWRVAAHLGALTFVQGGPPVPIARVQYDWALQVQRELGRAQLGVALSGGGPGRDYYDGYPHSKTALTATARWAF